MDHTVSAQSRATYSRQGGRLLDLCMVDNSHSVASASSDGTVHVRRTDTEVLQKAQPEVKTAMGCIHQGTFYEVLARGLFACVGGRRRA